MGSESQLGIVLSGGGSRAAFQVGVLKAIVEMKLPIRGSIISGLSAGAINAAFLGSQIHQPDQATLRLEQLWSSLSTDQVFSTRIFDLLKTGFKLIWDLSFGGIHHHTSTRALLKTEALRTLLQKHVNIEDLRRNIEAGEVAALTMAATDYSNGESVSFFDTKNLIQPWNRERRRAQVAEIHIEHVMASSAIPILFPPIAIGDRFFGDGCLRNASPLSSAIHLGSRKLIIVGVRKQSEAMKRLPDFQMPAFGRILSVLLNAILLDTTDFDVERMSRINETLQLLSKEQKSQTKLRPIDFVWITPSKDIGLMAKQNVHQLPFTLRYLLRGLGSKSESSEIASYLLFESDFCKRLIELGYSDAWARKSELESFFEKSDES